MHAGGLSFASGTNPFGLPMPARAWGVCRRVLPQAARPSACIAACTAGRACMRFMKAWMFG